MGPSQDLVWGGDPLSLILLCKLIDESLGIALAVSVEEGCEGIAM